MEAGWICIYRCVSREKALVVHAGLMADGIDAIHLSKQDSMYLFGHQEIWINENDVDDASLVLQNIGE